jgi:hypothetical protein
MAWKAQSGTAWHRGRLDHPRQTVVQADRRAPTALDCAKVEDTRRRRLRNLPGHFEIEVLRLNAVSSPKSAKPIRLRQHHPAVMFSHV